MGVFTKCRHAGAAQKRCGECTTTVCEVRLPPTTLKKQGKRKCNSLLFCVRRFVSKLILQPALSKITTRLVLAPILAGYMFSSLKPIAPQ